MSEHKTPSSLAIWLGLADNSYTSQKTVKFGDASAVNSGRFYSILIVVLLLAAWVITSVFGLVKPFYWPTIDGTAERIVKLVSEGYRNVPLWEHVGISVFRVLAGVVSGALVGIPLGFAMGLSSVARGLFDPIVEFMRPIPPLALIPLIILWFGIDETAKISLLFTVHHDNCSAVRRFKRADLQGACGLFAGRVKIADPDACYPAECAAGNIHRSAHLHGCVLGNGCRRRTGCR